MKEQFSLGNKKYFVEDLIKERRISFFQIINPFIYSVILILLPLINSELSAQAFQGYTLFGPHNSRYTYLIDMNTNIVKTWTSTRNGGYTAYLLEDGSMMRTATSSSSSLNGGGAQGVVQKFSWDGTLTWEYTYSTSTYRAHHDIEPMPNGNVLIIAWEVKTAAQAVQAGLNHSAVIWPDHIIEVQPVGANGGNIVWKWHAWDHLIQDFDPTKNNYGVVANHPELLDINVGSAGSGDWMHVNGISYNPELDQIVFSSHNLNEIYVIDHSTTIEEAAGHTGGRYGKGGDFLYRWGMPSNYRAPGSQVFKVVHCAYWVPKGLPGEGHLMAFNNREGQGTSMVVELVPPQDSAGFYSYTPGTAYGPSSPIWSYTASGFYSNHLGGVQRLPNGNTLIVQSTSGIMFEVDQAGNKVWNYNRGGEIVRALRYAPTYPGLRMYSSNEIVINEYMTNNNSIPDPSGEFDPWIEIYNLTNETITLSGRYLTNDASQPKKWAFPYGTKIEPNGYLIVWADGQTTQPGLHSNFTLSGSGGKVMMSNIDLSLIDSSNYGQQTNNLSMARMPNGTGPFVQSEPTFMANNNSSTNINAGAVVINEFISLNGYISDPSGEFDPWIELYNNTEEAINLSGRYLTNNQNELTQWQFPTGTFILPNSYLIVWADGDIDQPGLHTNFTLSDDNGNLLLTNPNLSLIDSTSYGKQILNLSMSRIPNGTGDFVRGSPSFNAQNIVVPNINPGNVVINEFLVLNSIYPDPAGEYDPWIELYNNTDKTIDLSGRFLSNDLDLQTKWFFPLNTAIPGKSYLIVWADGDIEQEGLHTNFRLSQVQDKIFMSNADLSFIDSVTFGEQTLNISMARVPNGTGPFVERQPTFNANNDSILVSGKDNYIPTSLILEQNYPNPFNPSTTISFYIPEASMVKLEIFDVLGEKIATLLEDRLTAGQYIAVWEADNFNSGVYFYKLSGFNSTGESFVQVKKMMLLK